MNKKGNAGILIFLILAVAAWGFIGGQQSQQIGITCDMGVGENFCWKWHTNTVGQVQEFAKDTGNTIKDFLDK